MKEPFKTILYIVLFLFVVAIGSVVVRDGSEILAGVGQYIMYLFQ